MHSMEEDSDIQGGWSGSKGNRNRDRFGEIRNRLCQLKKDGSSAHRKSSVLDVLKRFGISRLSVSKVEILQGSMEGKHLVITCTWIVNNQEISTHTLIDCGAPGIEFMNQDFAGHHQIPLLEWKEKSQVEVIDGRPIKSGDIPHIPNVGMMIQEHKEQLPMFITKLGHYPIVLEIPWVRFHIVAVRFASNLVTIGAQSCMTHCHYASVTVQGVTEEPPEPVDPQNRGIFEPQIHPP